jgi:predicted lipoprotein with Yx(FWY)xxD motif
MRALIVVVVLGVVVVPAAGAEARAKPTVSVESSRFGPTAVDRNGFTLYLFTKESGRRSECYGACAAAWPPYLLKGRLRAGRGIRRSLLGTTRRSDGSRQVTYRGHPLYHYVGEKHAGEIFCQNVNEYGGDWLIVKPDGTGNQSPH